MATKVVSYTYIIIAMVLLFLTFFNENSLRLQIVAIIIGIGSFMIIFSFLNKKTIYMGGFELTIAQKGLRMFFFVFANLTIMGVMLLLYLDGHQS